MRNRIIILFISVILHSCQKDGALIGTSVPTLDTPLSLQLDSSCLKAPNFISANGDGINDHFHVMHYEPLQAFTMVITNPNANIVRTISDPDQGWNGHDAEFMDEAGPVPYLYTIQLTTMSGLTHSISKVVHVIKNTSVECISAAVPPEAGDQYDPRRLCDFLYPSNDQICME